MYKIQFHDWLVNNSYIFHCHLLTILLYPVLKYMISYILQGYSWDADMCTAGLLSIIFTHSCSARQTSGDIFIEWESETVISQPVEGDVVCPDWVMRFRPAVRSECNSATSHYRSLHTLHHKNHWFNLIKASITAQRTQTHLHTHVESVM